MQGNINEYKAELPEPISDFEDFGHIKLERVANCRDLGGLPCADGCRVKPKKLIRSAELHNATDQDLETLMRKYDMSRVVDFRTSFEAKLEKDPILKMEGVEYVNLRPIATEGELIDDQEGALTVLKQFVSDTPKFFTDMYKDMVTNAHSAKVYSRFLNMLLENSDGSTLWHCTQGKDRTGLAAMFVERALGASEEVIKADYLASNLFLQVKRGRLDDILGRIPFLKSVEIDKEVVAYVRLGNLEYALDVIKQEHGSLDEYIKNVLDFDDDKQAKLREMYLD